MARRCLKRVTKTAYHMPELTTALTTVEPADLACIIAERTADISDDPRLVAVLIAQSALETGHWRMMRNYNFGNVKAHNKWVDGGGGYTFFSKAPPHAEAPVSETMSRAAAHANMKLARKRPDADELDMVFGPAKGGNRILCWFWARHPQTRFRAFATLREGAEAWLSVMRGRYRAALEPAARGDIAGYCRELKRLGPYFTEDVDRYAGVLQQLFQKYLPIVRAALPSAVEIDPSPHSMSLSSADLPETYILERERILLNELRAGRCEVEWVPITIGGRLRVKVLRDALRWLVDGKLRRLALSAYSLQQSADILGAVVGTPKFSDICAREAHNSGGLVRPNPQPINDRTSGHIKHSQAIDEDLPSSYRGIVRGWKGWYLSLDVWEKRGYATNYGWPVPKGINVGLPLVPSVSDPEMLVVQGPHEAHNTGKNTDDDSEAEIAGHSDYSQIASDLILDACELDGKPAKVSDIIEGKHGANPAKLLSHEGPLPDSRLPGVPLGSAEHVDERIIEVEPPQPLVVNATVSGVTLLRRGYRGPMVQELQGRLGLEETTEFFGPVTERMVRAFQASRRLTVDGIVGPQTWAALGQEPPKVVVEPKQPRQAHNEPHYSLPGIEFRQAKNYRRGRHNTGPRWITIHTAEIAETSQAAERLMYACATWDRNASWHTAADNDSITRSVADADTAWAAGPGNDEGLHLELAGVARQKARDWTDAYSLDEMKFARRMVRYWSAVHNIPLVRVTAEQLLPGQEASGVCDHATWSAASVLARKHGLKHPRFWNARRNKPRSTNHGDVGQNYPWVALLAS